MKASKLHTLWLMVYTGVITGYICCKAIIRQIFSRINRTWVDKTTLRWANKIVNSIKINVKIINPYSVEPKPGEPTIVMCNHSSLYDIPLSFLAFPNHSLRMLAKKELAKIPLMGGGMKAAEFPLIDRKNRQQALIDLQYVRELLESGIVMWMAPEGTRSKDGKIGPLKRGGFITAIQTKAKIIPMGIRGASDILPAHTLQVNLNKTAEIHIGRPIDAANYTLENKEELIDKVHRELKELVGQ